MSQDTENVNIATANYQRVTIGKLAETILANGQAKTKEEAKAKARFEVAKANTAKAKEKLKAIDEAKKRLEKERAKKERHLESERRRKADTKMKIEWGGLVVKAGLKDETDNVILGILLAGFQHIEKLRGRFEDMGRKKFGDDEQDKAIAKAEAKRKAQEEADDSTTEDKRSYRPCPSDGVILITDYADEQNVRALGAFFDDERKKWWCFPADRQKFTRWLPE